MDIRVLFYMMTADDVYAKSVAPLLKPEYIGDETSSYVAETVVNEVNAFRSPTKASVLLAVEEKAGQNVAKAWSSVFDEAEEDGYGNLNIEKKFEITEEFLRTRYTSHLGFKIATINEKLHKGVRNKKEKERLLSLREKYAGELAEAAVLKIYVPDIKGFVSDFETREIEYKMLSASGASTGLRNMDRAMGGKTFVPGTLSVFMAPPFSGKCVVGDTKIKVRIGGIVRSMTMRELYEYAEKNGAKKRGKGETWR